MNLSTKRQENAANWRGVFSLTVFFAIFTLTGAQFIVLQHSHDGDMVHQMDCSTCLKQSVELYFFNAQKFRFDVLGQGLSFASQAYEVVFFPIICANSRSPPIA
ncbi:MAG: hypothetical protein P8K27_02580 [Gammaproteobacteria bacterium]|nr:hypothetical protein [Gammaproteobacteria bacterium]